MEIQCRPIALLFPCGVRKYDVRVRLVHNFGVDTYKNRGTNNRIWKMIFVDSEVNILTYIFMMIFILIFMSL